MNWKVMNKESPLAYLPLHKKTVIGMMITAILFIAGSAVAVPSDHWRTFGVGGEIAYSVQNTIDGGHIFAGETVSYGKGVVDAWLVKTDEKGNEQWNRTFGGTEQDYAYSVQQTKDGGYIIAGETISYGGRNYNAWLIKTDASGNEQWNNTYGRDGLDAARIVQITKDGGYILAGYTSSYGAGSEDIWIIKTDVNGEEEWNRTYGGVKSDQGYSVHQTSDGGYIIAGMAQSFGSGAYLIKTDASGREEWNRVLEGTGDGIAYSVQQTKDGGYIVAGEKGRFWADESDAWLIKTDSNGIQQWGRTFGGKSGETIYSVQQTMDEGYILGGATKSYGAGDSDVWVIKTDSEGNEEWNRTIGGKSADEARSILRIDNDYIVAGMYSPDWVRHDAMIARISDKISAETIAIPPNKEAASAAPVEEWNKTFKGAGNVSAQYIQQTSDGGYIFAGATCSRQQCIPWLVKTDARGNEQWNRTFMDIYGAKSVQQTADGGYILAGAKLIRTDAEGIEKWNRTFYGTFNSILQTQDGGYMGAGAINTEIGDYHPDGWLIKTDENGYEKWNRTFRGHGFGYINSVEHTSDGGFVLAGYRASPENKGGAWLIKVDSNGNELWNRTFGEWNRTFGGRGEMAYSVQQTKDGGYILAGFGFLFIKTDANGNMLWGKNKIFKGKELAVAHSARQTSDGGYIIAGDAYSEGGFNKDSWLIKVDENGNEQWNMTFGGAQNSEAYSVQQTKDGSYIIAGTTFYIEGGNYAWLRKVRGEQTGTAKTPDASPTETPTATPTQTPGAVSNETQTKTPPEKAAGFEVVLSITIFLAVYIAGRKNR